MTEQIQLHKPPSREDRAKIERLAARGDKIEADPRVDALFNLADRITFQAMRCGGFDYETAKLVGDFEPWGLFVRDLKRAVDGAKVGKRIACPEPPAIPGRIDPDLIPSVRHFAAAAGVALPDALRG